MRVTVCELRNDARGLEEDWSALAAHVRSASSDLVLLPEMPFWRWLAASPNVDPAAWARSVEAHERWFERFGETGARAVIGSRPTTEDGRRFNRAFAWERGRGLLAVGHGKRYLPEEPGFHEASWTDRGAPEDGPVEVLGIRVGFAICTELWFFGIARAHAAAGTHLLVCPRATPAATSEKWVAGGRTAAVVSGAYCLSSNFSGEAGLPGGWGGAGWVAEPEEGDLLARTSKDARFRTVEIDPSAADAAKRTYPRSVPDGP